MAGGGAWAWGPGAFSLAGSEEAGALRADLARTGHSEQLDSSVSDCAVLGSLLYPGHCMCSSEMCGSLLSDLQMHTEGCAPAVPCSQLDQAPPCTAALHSGRAVASQCAVEQQ